MQKTELTSKRLREFLKYDAETGEFHRLTTGGGIKAGAKAGCVNRGGYMVVRVDGVLYYAHRLAWLYVTGAWPEHILDHFDGDRMNNRFANLREATWEVNAQNLRGPKKNSKSGLLGVCWSKNDKRWIAQIYRHGEGRVLGYFKSAEEAHQSYLTAKRREHEGCTL